MTVMSVRTIPVTRAHWLRERGQCRSMRHDRRRGLVTQNGLARNLWTYFDKLRIDSHRDMASIDSMWWRAMISSPAHLIDGAVVASIRHADKGQAISMHALVLLERETGRVRKSLIQRASQESCRRLNHMAPVLAGPRRWCIQCRAATMHAQQE